MQSVSSADTKSDYFGCFLFWRRRFFFVPPVPSKPIITRAAVNSVELEQLIEEFSLFKSDTASELMRRNYVRHQQEQRRKMLAKLEDNSQHADSQVRSMCTTHRKLFHCFLVLKLIKTRNQVRGKRNKHVSAEEAKSWPDLVFCCHLKELCHDTFWLLSNWMKTQNNSFLTKKNNKEAITR